PRRRRARPRSARSFQPRDDRGARRGRRRAQHLRRGSRGRAAAGRDRRTEPPVSARALPAGCGKSLFVASRATKRSAFSRQPAHVTASRLRFFRSLLAAALAAGVALASSSRALAHATLVVKSKDGDGEGFNDKTPVAPVGGNMGKTLGEQRLNAVQ